MSFKGTSRGTIELGSRREVALGNIEINTSDKSSTQKEDAAAETRNIND